MTNEASAKYLNFVAGKPFSHFQIIRQWPTGIVSALIVGKSSGCLQTIDTKNFFKAMLICGVVINLIAWTIYCQFKKQSNLITEFRGNFGKGLLERFDTRLEFTHEYPFEPPTILTHCVYFYKKYCLKIFKWKG